MKIIPILPIFKGENKNHLDKQEKKEYNTKCQREFKEYLKECLNNERQSIL